MSSAFAFVFIFRVYFAAELFPFVSLAPPTVCSSLLGAISVFVYMVDAMFYSSRSLLSFKIVDLFKS